MSTKRRRRSQRELGLLALVIALLGSGLLYVDAWRAQQREQALLRHELSTTLQEQARRLSVRSRHWSSDWQAFNANPAHPIKDLNRHFQAFWSSRPAPRQEIAQAVLSDRQGQPLALVRLSAAPLATPAIPPASPTAPATQLLLQPPSQAQLISSSPTRLPDGSPGQLTLTSSLATTLEQVSKLLQLGEGRRQPVVLLESHRHASRHASHGPSGLLQSGQQLELEQLEPLTNADLVLAFPGRRDARLIWLSQVGWLLLSEGLLFGTFTASRLSTLAQERRLRLGLLRQQRQQEQQQRKQRKLDPLTGLLNLPGFVAGLAAQKQAYPQLLQAVMVVDLDRFTLINARLSRAVGDEVLQQLAVHLSALCHGSSLLARQDGDRFAIGLLGSSSAGLEHTLADLSQALSRFELLLSGGSLVLTARCGAMLLDPTRAAPEEALHGAGFACDEAKRRQERLVISDQALPVTALGSYQELQELHQQLNQAINSGSLLLYGQPVWHTDGTLRRSHHLEVLCRLPDPAGGADQWSERYIDAALFWGTEAALDFAVLQQLSEALIARPAPPDLLIAVNITQASLEQPRFAEHLSSWLERTGLPPQQLCLEITEQSALRQRDATISRLRALRRRGLKIALDDFGAGMTSLGYLQELPLDIVKLDRSLVHNLVAAEASSACRASRAVVQFLLQLGAQLGFELIAEGVDTESIRECLEQLGVQQQQGYLFGKPTPLLASLEERKAAQHPPVA